MNLPVCGGQTGSHEGRAGGGLAGPCAQMLGVPSERGSSGWPAARDLPRPGPRTGRRESVLQTLWLLWGRCSGLPRASEFRGTLESRDALRPVSALAGGVGNGAEKALWSQGAGRLGVRLLTTGACLPPRGEALPGLSPHLGDKSLRQAFSPDVGCVPARCPAPVPPGPVVCPWYFPL